MLKRILATSALVALPLFLFGADAAKAQPATAKAQPAVARAARPKQAAKKPAAKAPAPSPKQILVRVNGVDITRGELDRYIDMMAALLQNKRKTPLPPDMLAKFKKKNRKPLSDELYQRTLFRTCLMNSNITATAQAKAAVERECLRNFGKRKQKLPELKAYVAKAGFEKEFAANMEFDIRLKSFLTTVCSNEYYASPADLAKARANIAAYNKKAAATNTVVAARAAGILKRAKGGEDFGRLADEYSQDPERNKGGDMGDCDESDFADEKHVWRILSALPVGSVSDLLETEDGYSIFKVVRRNTAEKSETGDASLTLARIFFRRAYVIPDQSDDELLIDLEQEKRRKLMVALYRRFRAQSDVSYPNGPVRAQ